MQNSRLNSDAIIYLFNQIIHLYNLAAQLRQPIENNSLVLCHLKTLRLYIGLFKFELDHYFDKRSTSKMYVLGLTDSLYKFVT